eukprot:scaffold56841_cov30-Tisochrysis_lutea.AAC.3
MRASRPLGALRGLAARRLSSKAAIPPPRLFSYEQVTAHIHVSDAIEAVEKAFGALAKGKVSERSQWAQPSARTANGHSPLLFFRPPSSSLLRVPPRPWSPSRLSSARRADRSAVTLTRHA